MCVEAGAEFALSSDAHAPDQVGFAYDEALEFLSSLGVEQICVFEGRERRLEPLGRPGDGRDRGDETPARRRADAARGSASDTTAIGWSRASGW